ELEVKTGADYVHLLPSKDLLAAGLDSIYSVPTTFFVDSEGKVVGETYTGSRSKEAWSEIMNEMLEKIK
ncbi:MAG: TlpA family protein disulfide reductase, partial [Lachnospiraceae bacterium]|nr:TlpA family protein disulfide reductase [Lachnospiraceae bacterium]